LVKKCTRSPTRQLVDKGAWSTRGHHASGTPPRGGRGGPSANMREHAFYREKL
jgi:hypothetical protein